MLSMLLNTYPEGVPSGLKTDQLRFAMCGSAPVPAEVMRKFEETFNCPVIEGYGLSESTCRSTFNPPDERRRPGSCGMPIGNEMKVVDDDDNEVEVAESELGRTVAQPASGALRPTIIVGVGNFGRRALIELRCRFLDRFGDLSKIPLLRFLYVDTDAEAVQASLRGSPELALSPGEVYHLALQPVGHYRRRQLDQLSDWLPREKLYAMPRSLKTQGSRALGRLAFADNHLRLLTRLKNEVQRAAHPDALFQSVSQTGLALRDSVPRVYVIAAAGGGGSGLLVDLGYAVRRLLQQRAIAA